MTSSGFWTQSSWFRFFFFPPDLQYSMFNILQFTQFFSLRFQKGKYWRKLGNLLSVLTWNACFFDETSDVARNSALAPRLPFHLYTLPVVGFLLIFRKFASSSTKMCIRGQQLFTVFELQNLTQEISFTWSLHLSILTYRKRSMNNNCHFRVAPLQLFIWLCVFPDVQVIGSDTKNQIAGF